MDWFDWLTSREIRQFILDHNLFFPLAFVVRLVVMTGIEWIRPARQVDYRKVLGRDILLISIYWFGMVPISEYIDRLIAVRPNLPVVILQLPLPVRVLCYFVIADLGHYWIHRLMHHRYV